MKTIKVEWTTRAGVKLWCRFATVEAAKHRLAILDSLEADTQRWAPTDSGDSRFCMLEEAKAIRAALEKL